MRRLLKQLKINKQPRFILHPRYILPKLTGPLALHRQLFFLSNQHPARLLINFYAYLSWISFTVWSSSYKACRSKPAEKLKLQTNLTSLALFRNLLKLGVFYGIAPRYYFKYELFKPENKQQTLRYFYNAELPYFHDYTNKQFPNHKQAARLMGDKQGFALALKKIGLPSVPGHIYKSSDLQTNASILYSKKSLFCKPNHGSRSADAFLMAYDEQTTQYHIKPVTQPDIYDSKAISNYLNQVFSCHNTLLIQDFIEDHPEIHAMSQQEPTTTVRIITEKSHHGSDTVPELLYLQLELPKEKQERQFYAILPLALDSLEVDPVFKSKNKNTVPQEPYPVISDALKKELRQSIAICIQAHAKLLAMRSVSFDIIIGKNGPVVLEANYNWSIEMLYNVIDVSMPPTHPAAHWLNRMILGQNILD